MMFAARHKTSNKCQDNIYVPGTTSHCHNSEAEDEIRHDDLCRQGVFKPSSLRKIFTPSFSSLLRVSKSFCFGLIFLQQSLSITVQNHASSTRCCMCAGKDCSKPLVLQNLRNSSTQPSFKTFKSDESSAHVFSTMTKSHTRTSKPWSRDFTLLSASKGYLRPPIFRDSILPSLYSALRGPNMDLHETMFPHDRPKFTCRLSKLLERPATAHVR